jgi:lipid kinase YegS
MPAFRLILNGKSAQKPAVRKAVGELRKLGHIVEVRVTWEGGDVRRLVEEALRDATSGLVDTIVAGGGDGTVNAIFGQAFMAGIPAGCTFGILPLGTANDFARSIGVPVDDLTAALLLGATARASSIDMGLIDGRPFVNMVTGGFGSRITAETDPGLKRRLGGLAYALTGIARIKDLSANGGVFRAEGFEWEGPFTALAIGNGRQAGGGIQLCPDARIDDGLLDLTILPYLAPREQPEILGRLLRDGAAGVRGLLKTARSPWIEYESSEELHVNLDGEPIRTRRFRVECRPGAISVHAGQTPLIG